MDLCKIHGDPVKDHGRFLDGREMIAAEDLQGFMADPRQMTVLTFFPVEGGSDDGCSAEAKRRGRS